MFRDKTTLWGLLFYGVVLINPFRTAGPFWDQNQSNYEYFGGP